MCGCVLVHACALAAYECVCVYACIEHESVQGSPSPRISACLCLLFLMGTVALYRVCSTGLRLTKGSPSFCLFRFICVFCVFCVLCVFCVPLSACVCVCYSLCRVLRRVLRRCLRACLCVIYEIRWLRKRELNIFI